MVCVWILHISVCALNRTKSFTQLSLFNFGRICGYTFAGFLFGAFGEFINLGPSRFCCELSIYPIRGALLSLLFPGVTIIVVGICLLKRKELKLPSFNWLSKMLTGGRTKNCRRWCMHYINTMWYVICSLCNGCWNKEVGLEERYLCFLSF